MGHGPQVGELESLPFAFVLCQHFIFNDNVSLSK